MAAGAQRGLNAVLKRILNLHEEFIAFALYLGNMGLI